MKQREDFRVLELGDQRAYRDRHRRRVGAGRGLTSAATGKTKSRHSRSGKTARIGAGKDSIFFAETRLSGLDCSFSFAVLIESHIVHGCSPSKVFYTPESNEPSASV